MASAPDSDGPSDPAAPAGSDRAQPEQDVRVAATLLLTRDDPFEVLMVRRHAKATFASALVFPGGALDLDDSDPDWLAYVTGADELDDMERGRRVAAVRETWEEASILVACAADGTPAVVEPNHRGLPFREALVATRSTVALDTIIPFAHWITPIIRPRRFDTYFYIAAAPAGQAGVSDGGETVGIEWINPRDSEQIAANDSILFPTMMNLTRLAESDHTEGALAAASARPIVTVRPVMTASPDGSQTITIASDAGYDNTSYPMPNSER